MLIYSFITDYQAFSLRYKDNTTRDKNETKVGKQSANLGKNNEPIQNRLSFLIDCKSVILHHLTILSFPMVRPAWDNWWFLQAGHRLWPSLAACLEQPASLFAHGCRKFPDRVAACLEQPATRHLRRDMMLSPRADLRRIWSRTSWTNGLSSKPPPRTALKSSSRRVLSPSAPKPVMEVRANSLLASS